MRRRHKIMFGVCWCGVFICFFIFYQVNVIPVIAKADTVSKSELDKLKIKIMSELVSNGVQIYQFPTEDEAVAEINSSMNVSPVARPENMYIADGLNLLRPRWCFFWFYFIEHWFLTGVQPVLCIIVQITMQFHNFFSSLKTKQHPKIQLIKNRLTV